MKIIKIDQKFGEIVVFVETLDDLWHLEKIIETNDIISGKTDRKIKPKNEGEKTIRQTIFIELAIDSVHFQEFSENLKIGGIILGGNPKELVEIKSHHSLDVRIGDKVKIKKVKIKNWQIDRLKKAEKESATAKLLIVLMDDEASELAFVSQFAIEKKGKIRSGKQGKQYAEQKDTYFEDVLDKIIQLKPNKILVVGPGFTKENFSKFYADKKINGLPKLITETINSTGETGFRELIAGGKLELIQKELQLTKETQIIERFLENLAKEKGEYGPDAIKEKLSLGAIETVLVSETFLLENRDLTEEVLDLAEKMGSKIHIISSKNPQEKTIFNMGGIVAILRYKS